MKTARYHLNNDRGLVIITALMILALLTIIGIAATNMSSTELTISTNSLLYERAFYTAEAGLERAKESLRAPFVDQNKATIAGGGEGDWSFALDGAAGFPVPSVDPELGVLAVELIAADNLNSVIYRVRFWDNDDENPGPQDYFTDSDGLVWIRADAWGPRGGRCSIEELVEGSSTGGSVSGYSAQEGASSGKAYTANDTKAISNFTKQL